MCVDDVIVMNSRGGGRLEERERWRGAGEERERGRGKERRREEPERGIGKEKRREEREETVKKNLDCAVPVSKSACLVSSSYY